MLVRLAHVGQERVDFDVFANKKCFTLTHTRTPILNTNSSLQSVLRHLVLGWSPEGTTTHEDTFRLLRGNTQE